MRRSNAKISRFEISRRATGLQVAKKLHSAFCVPPSTPNPDAELQAREGEGEKMFALAEPVALQEEVQSKYFVVKSLTLQT